MRSVRAVLLSQGDEVVTGQIVDTNAAWIADRLTALGVDVVAHHTVGDRLDDLIAWFRQAAGRADVVISTGGLGPTQDDLTAEAVGRAFGRPLHLDAEALAHVEALYARFGRPMPEANRKQAMLPEGCTPLPNARGTATGFAVEAEGAWIACLPGVPHEMRAMVRDQVEPALHARAALAPSRLIVLRTAGAGESLLQDRIGAFSHPRVVLAFRTAIDENQIKLRVPPGLPDAEVDALVLDLLERIGSPVFAVDGWTDPRGRLGGGSLVEDVARRLTAAGHTLAVAESCTGGRIAAACTGLPGSSAWFQAGFVTYANEAKARDLSVPEAVLAAHGAVSEPVARAMAEGARDRAGTTFALATTGIAGPGGATPTKPVGLVHLALATPAGTLHREGRFGGDRHRVQALACAAALDLLRRHLHEVAPHPVPGAQA